MKKLASLLLGVVLSLTLVACGSTPPDADVQHTHTGTETVVESSSTETDSVQTDSTNTDVIVTTESDVSDTSEDEISDDTDSDVLQSTNTDTNTTEPVCNHNYAVATCTEPAKCTKCGETTGNALGHTWKDATCTEAKKCTKCGETSGNALGHKFSEATCTDPAKCTKCGTTSGDALGHTWKDATCTEAKKCIKCGLTASSALGHAWTDGSCTEPKRCTRCGTTSGKATGHTWKEATCNERKTCTKCGETTGWYADHTWKEATCTEPKKCTTCGTTIGWEAEHTWADATCTSPMKCTKCGATSGTAEHTWKDATCTEPKKCGKCGKTDGSVLGHKFNEFDFWSDYDTSGKCIRCDYVLPEAKEYITFNNILLESKIKNELHIPSSNKVSKYAIGKLTSLTLTFGGDISDLKHAVNLTSITIDSVISNPNVLCELKIKKLKIDYLAGEKIDLSFLKNMKHLEFLDTWEFPEDPSVLLSSPKLKTLRIYTGSGGIKNIDFLKNNRTIENLIFDWFDNRLDLSGLKTMANLKSITFRLGETPSSEQEEVLRELVKKGIVIQSN
ncbi:MAG: hypothetical protein J6B86_03080 [Clostridia bacterium]|nr:hypothetical protein [Clostridia bacterium]